eukprot:TRINITY_DN8602_c0_g1_i3.p1 TRINITY_DN8602_c0_g1~~TRINITY_DN8602_c0_g1_i3.p1  ORF type:complete len:117 (-),score=26.57 TRINITY_DN8602_c0_g1_i3:170-520(-)
MVVRIRLSRFGCKNRPFYRVMAADSRSPRDGKHLEVLGYYNPLPGQDGGKRMGLNFDRVKSGLLPPPPMLAMARKGGPRDTRVVDPLSGRFVALKEPTVSGQPEGEGDEAKNETSS